MGDYGNFQLWNQNKTFSFWSTKTNGSIGAKLYLQIDGNLIVKDLARHPLWASETTTVCPGLKKIDILIKRFHGSRVLLRTILLNIYSL